MSLSIPKILYLNDTYDADEDMTIYFSYSLDYDDYDCVQVVVENNDTLNNEYDKINFGSLYNEIYVSTLNGMSSLSTNSITIPNGKLFNGHEYLIRLRVGITNDDVISWSNYSKREIVKCYKPADLIAQNNDFIANAQYFDLIVDYVKYYDSNNSKFCITDNIDYYYCELSDENKKILYTTTRHYTSKNKNLLQRIDELSNNSNYYITFYCVSKNGLEISKEYYIIVKYEEQKNGANIEGCFVDNNVLLKISSKQYLGVELNGKELVYNQFDNLYTGNHEIDLTDNSVLLFQGGINVIDDNYAMQVWLRDIRENEEIIKLKDDNDRSIIVKYINKKFYVSVNYKKITSLYVSKEVSQSDLSNENIVYLCVIFDNFGECVSITTSVK